VSAAAAIKTPGFWSQSLAEATESFWESYWEEDESDSEAILLQVVRSVAISTQPPDGLGPAAARVQPSEEALRQPGGRLNARRAAAR
jgi:hypothetical protein